MQRRPAHLLLHSQHANLAHDVVLELLLLLPRVLDAALQLDHGPLGQLRPALAVACS